ncbi:MAG: glucose 1-dehydrogenase [Hyphomicrobiales bacterium]
MTSKTMFDLEGKKALVTGASRGLGQAMAIGLAECGADVAITSRAVGSLEETAGHIGKLSRRALKVELDVCETGTIEPAINGAAEKLGGLDILINNAGYEEVRPSLDVDEALWEKINSTNLKGAFFSAQAAARLMTANRRPGSIVNVCSLTSFVGVPTAVPYGSSKTGLLGMTRALSAEWAAHGIRVNAIAPGYFRTELTDVFYQDEDWSAAMLQKIPMSEFGDLEDVKGSVVFLSSSAARYITGQCIGIDGGYLASI